MIADETLAQLAGAVPSHVFAQGGVGGLPAGVFAPFWERFGDARPRFVVVEPNAADCLFRSAVAGRPTAVPALAAASGLDSDSHVLIVGSEGATDPAIYSRITGRSPESVVAGGTARS